MNNKLVLDRGTKQYIWDKHEIDLVHNYFWNKYNVDIDYLYKWKQSYAVYSPQFYWDVYQLLNTVHFTWDTYELKEIAAYYWNTYEVVNKGNYFWDRYTANLVSKQYSWNRYLWKGYSTWECYEATAKYTFKFWYALSNIAPYLQLHSSNVIFTGINPASNNNSDTYTDRNFVAENGFCPEYNMSLVDLDLSQIESIKLGKDITLYLYPETESVNVDDISNTKWRYDISSNSPSGDKIYTISDYSTIMNSINQTTSTASKKWYFQTRENGTEVKTTYYYTD